MAARKKSTPITVDAMQCLSLLTNVARAASTDDCLPMIYGVLLHGAVHEGKPVLVATATDRFIIVQGSIDATGEPLPEVFVPLDEVKRVATVLRSLPKSTTLLEISAPGNGTASFVARNASVTSDPKAQTKGWTPPEFPDFRHLFAEPKLEPEVEANKVAVNGFYLSKLATMAKALGNDFRLRTFGPTKPAHVLIGDRTRALIMPIRQHGEITMLPLFTPPSEQKRLDEKAAAKAKREAELAAADEQAEREVAKGRHPAGKKAPAPRRTPARKPAVAKATPAPRRTRAKAAA